MFRSKRPRSARAWFPGPDSAEVSCFGVAKSRYRFDAAGHLLRADGRATTSAYVVNRVAAIDIDATPRGRRDPEMRSARFGLLSPRGETACGHLSDFSFGSPATPCRSIGETCRGRFRRE
jgi:hypothetical protein